MIGISLNPRWLMPGASDEFSKKFLSSFGGRDSMLDSLKRAGVGSIELRTITEDMDAGDVLDIFIMLIKRGFNVTVHGSIKNVESAQSSVFSPLSLVLRDGIVDRLMITVHPLSHSRDTVAALRALSDYARNYRTKIVFALENNRLMPDGTEGEASWLILDMIRAVNRDNVRICWDFGHMWNNVCRLYDGDRNFLPSQDFMHYTVHTHIHGVHGENLTTHFPPDNAAFPLREWMDRVGCDVIYNMEPEPGRYPHDSDYKAMLLGGIREIASCISPTRAAIDELHLCDREIWKNAASVIKKEKNCYALCGPSSYIIKLGNTAFGVDLCMRQSFTRSNVGHLRELLSGLKYIFISHDHVDHYDTHIMRELAGSGIKWIIPDFLDGSECTKILPGDEIISAHELEPIYLDGILAIPFKSLHYRPNSSNGVPEYGYVIETPQRRILLPGDIRDYSYDSIPHWGEGNGIDLMFAHLWFGDNNAENLPCEPYRSQFADFVTAFNPRKAAITHLYESGREKDSIWTYAHAGIAEDAVFARNPGIECYAPRLGRIYGI